MVEALSSFFDWFIKARSMLFPMEDAPELQELARLMKKLQNVISQKNLVKIGSSVEFSKSRGPDHTSSEILSFASTAFTETQVFESGHKPNVKNLAKLTNRKDQFYCTAHHHDRTAHLSKIMITQAVAQHTKALARTRQDGEDTSSSDSATDASGGSDDGGSDDVLTHNEPEHSHRLCEVATKVGVQTALVGFIISLGSP